jgi:hypothetical protein
MQQASTARAHTLSPPSAPPGGRGRGSRFVSACRRGQSMVEFALTTMIAITMLFAILQLALIVVQRYGTSQVARQSARWLAVNIDATDAQLLTQARTYATDLPGVDLAATTSVTASPGCVSLTGTPPSCAARDSGNAVSVTVTVPIAKAMFLPTQYGIAPFQINFQSTNTSITYTVLLE